MQECVVDMRVFHPATKSRTAVSLAVLALLMLAGCEPSSPEGYQTLDPSQLTQSETAEQSADGTANSASSTDAVPASTNEPQASSTEPAEPAETSAASDQIPEAAPAVSDVAQASATSVPPAEVAPESEPSPQAISAALPVDDTATAADPNLTTPANSTDPTSTSLEEGIDPMTGLKREIKLLIPTMQFAPEGPDRALRVTYDDIDLLKVLNMEKVPLDVMDYLPEWLEGLDGKQVILRGWMYPPASETGISRFIFVRDNGVCCFGPKAKIYDKVGVSLKEGIDTHFIQGHSFDVRGTFHVEPIMLDEEEMMFLYTIDEAVVIDK